MLPDSATVSTPGAIVGGLQPIWASWDLQARSVPISHQPFVDGLAPTPHAIWISHLFKEIQITIAVVFSTPSEECSFLPSYDLPCGHRGFSWGSFNYHGLTLIPAWIINYIHSKVWSEITYPFPNFNGWTVELCEWISHFIAHFIMDHVTTCGGWSHSKWPCTSVFKTRGFQWGRVRDARKYH